MNHMKSKRFKGIRRIMATFMLLTVCFVYCSGFTAFAAVDLDVTIIPPEDSVQNNEEFTVNLQLVTKSANGYVELVIKIEYDQDMLTLAAPVNMDGYKVTGSKGQLTLTYFDPTGTNTPTPIGNDVTIPINFIVMESAAEGPTKIKATIDHAYNEKGKNVTWTPIYDKELEIIRINDAVDTSSDVASEETSSQFVVGDPAANTVNRTSGVSGNGGKIAAVLVGAIVIFAAGVVSGYILCMKKYEGIGANEGADAGRIHRLRDTGQDDYYDDYPKSVSRSKRKSDYDDYDDEYDDYKEFIEHREAVNDDDFYTPVHTNVSSDYDDDYFSSAPIGTGGSGNYLDAFQSPSFTGEKVEPIEFDSLHTPAQGSVSGGEDDDYPVLFMRRGGGAAKPTFDEQVDTLFGKYSQNVERNVDDGYGGISPSSSRRRDRRSERARRNR